MSDIAIEINEMSKQYRLGLIGTGTLSNDLNRWWITKIRRKEDPYLKIGEVNDRSSKGNSNFVWALRDINLQIQQGEVIGIIGKNGAGKSTLLKILSKVTKPTLGEVRYRGRIASLLEVGTGFHPEMTGRENVYMNGAIMGMTRSEIRNKFDEIVNFAGVERYIDTPVKRYSSGMTVRLGFAIAAHLEPDILVVDEVLAVGDAEFQKKAIGKMQDVSRGEGRTVLFVSHNMAAVSKLCQRCVLLADGQIKEVGQTSAIIDKYVSEAYHPSLVAKGEDLEIAMKNEDSVRLISAKIVNQKQAEVFYIDDVLNIEIEIEGQRDNVNLSVNFYNALGEIIVNTVSPIFNIKGRKKLQFTVPAYLLNYSIYTISIMIVMDKSKCIVFYPSVLQYELNDKRDDSDQWYGDISNHKTRYKLNWEELN